MDRTELRRVKQHLMSWGTGQAVPGNPAPGSVATIVTADPAHLAGLAQSGLIGPGTVVLAAGPDTPGAVGFDGALDEPGTEISIGDDFFLQTQDYATSEFMSIIGPTLVRVSDAADFRHFLSDADRAYAEGVFPEFATAPAVRIADLPGLGASPDGDGPRTRLYVNTDGDISTSPGGSGLGRVGDPLSALQASWDRANTESALPCSVCLGATVPEAERSRELLDRPWLGRYLDVLPALRTMTVNNVGGLRVSGFGGRITQAFAETGHDHDLREPSAPVVMWDDERGYVYDLASDRVFAVEHIAASAAELILATGSVRGAAEYAHPEALSQVERFFTDAGVSLVSHGTLAGV
ncbi:hypothetical protein NE857_32700 [Nocardiopsis exhalans]|uniref:Uncharacterized protein n=1 Tax=Nocardiopsis exhalans TaxID=163604 RepID=A0ABY5DA03_9ACTN|nr:daptide biosynthesis RiPP recognition protein [Nocardiopsis exhalans]USY19931.1 hypothetical protein NE857_32700 [Nocardiopsis exhalans]